MNNEEKPKFSQICYQKIEPIFNFIGKWLEKAIVSARKKLIGRLLTDILVGGFYALFNIIFQLIYKIPFVNKKRTRFEKERKPVFYFKTWKSYVVMGLIGSLFVVLLTNYLVTLLRACVPFIIQNSTSILSNIFNQTNIWYPFDLNALLLSNLFRFSIFLESPIFAVPIFLILDFVAWKSAWVNFEQFRDYNNNENGDDRFAEVAELKRQYKEIPDKTLFYEGEGGLPIAHFTNTYTLQGMNLKTKMQFRSKPLIKFLSYSERVLDRLSGVTGSYLIETDTVNMLITGMTRSGKGESFVNPTIDIISRAKKPSAMIISDPKGELYQSSYKTLRKRGYDVEVLSFQDMDWSMSYNPLALAIDSAKRGYYEKTQTRVNAVAESIYRKSKSGDGNSKYWEDTSISLFNAIAMALIDRANETSQHDEPDAWDTVTVRNIAKFLTDLGSEFVLIDASGNIIDENSESQQQPAEKKSKLTYYFDELRKVNAVTFSKFREMADINFRSSDFASEETKGNVYSSMMSGINLFLQDNIAKLTSKNSLDLESIGNPRRLSILFRSSTVTNENTFAHKGVKVSIIENKKRRTKNTQKEKYIVKNLSGIIDGAGYLNLVIDPKLPDYFTIEVVINETQEKLLIQGSKVYKRHPKNKNRFLKDEFSKERILSHIAFEIIEKPAMLLIDSESIEMIYSDKPKALFLVTPPNRNEYNAIVSLLIDQLFNANYEVALSAGRKTTNRIQFILDEFANIPMIPSMDQKLSIGLGQNIQFMLIVQNLEQIEDKYGKEVAKTILSNCSLNVLIKTTSKETAQEYSDLLGSRTITKRQKSGNIIDEANPNVSFIQEAQPLMTPNQLLKLEAGEAVFIRGVKAQDNVGRKVTPDPIFVHDETELPYRFMFLQTEFDQSMTLADIPIDSPHRNLDLQDIAVPAETALKHLSNWKNQIEQAKYGTFANLDDIPETPYLYGRKRN